MKYICIPFLLLVTSLHHGYGQTKNAQSEVENSLNGPVVKLGEEHNFTIRERMLHHGVPGVSVAVINQGNVEWASGYGLKNIEHNDSVTVSTLFQAASISKMITAFAVMRLAEQGMVDLDSDINTWLRTWKLPERGIDSLVNLRRLLSHTAGINVGAFPGYDVGQPIPSTEEVLLGIGNTPEVKIDTVPGSTFQYSGGGYTIIQMLIEDVTKMPFADIMKDILLDPVGMYQSTFSIEIPDHLMEEASVGHVEGTVMDGNWKIHPESAAAGLWTTPTDIARLLLMVSKAYFGDSCALLDKITCTEMLTVQKGLWTGSRTWWGW